MSNSQWQITKIEPGCALEILSDPTSYKNFIEHYGLLGELYRNLYLALMAFQPQEVKEPDFSFLNEELSLFHNHLHLFLKDKSFLDSQFSVQIVSWNDYPYLAQTNKFIDFSEMENELELAWTTSKLYSPRVAQHIQMEATAFELLREQYHAFLSIYLPPQEVLIYLDVLMRNFKNSLLFTAFGVPSNFFMPLMELYKRSYFYLGFGYSNSHQLCYYIGICR